MSLVGELGRELFLRDALEPVLDGYDHVVIDTPPNLGLLTVNALVCADRVLAPVSVEDEASLHGIFELRQTIAKLSRTPRRDGAGSRRGAHALAAPPDQQPGDRRRSGRRAARADRADPVAIGVDRAGGGAQSAARR